MTRFWSDSSHRSRLFSPGRGKSERGNVPLNPGKNGFPKVVIRTVVQTDCDARREGKVHESLSYPQEGRAPYKVRVKSSIKSPGSRLLPVERA